MKLVIRLMVAVASLAILVVSVMTVYKVGPFSHLPYAPKGSLTELGIFIGAFGLFFSFQALWYSRRRN